MTRKKDTKFAKEFGEKFRVKREKLEWTQEEVAKKAGINITTYARIERGDKEPTGSYLVKIAKVLEVSLT